MNLATQPWIKTIDEHNQLIKCSLYDVLAQAHHIKTIQGGTPLEYAAVFRLILALLYRSSQPITEADASRLLNTGQFDPAPIRTYLAKWRDRFNLFDEHFPFFQWAQPPTQLKPRNINRLFLHYSTGIKGTLHSHVHDSTRLNLTPAQAARAVITAQNFLTSGGQVRCFGIPALCDKLILSFKAGHCLRRSGFTCSPKTRNKPYLPSFPKQRPCLKTGPSGNETTRKFLNAANHRGQWTP